MWLATILTILNKIFDVAPEILIGFAVDVVVTDQNSLVSQWTGIHDRWHQLLFLGILNVVIWVLESASEYGYSIVWRNLAQTVEHDARMDAYAHVQRLELGYFEDASTGGLMSILNDDINQLERFLDTGAKEIIHTVVNVIIVGIVMRRPLRRARARPGARPRRRRRRAARRPLPGSPRGPCRR